MMPRTCVSSCGQPGTVWTIVRIGQPPGRVGAPLCVRHVLDALAGENPYHYDRAQPVLMMELMSP